MSRGRTLLVPMLAIILLSASMGIQGAKNDTVLLPLVEEDSNTGIPVTIEGRYVSIELIEPLGERIHVPLNKDRGGVTVTIVNGLVQEIRTIPLQDWPQSGDVIPLSQDWPQDGQLYIPMQDWPQKTTLCIIIPQDWPQYEIDGILL